MSLWSERLGQTYRFSVEQCVVHSWEGVPASVVVEVTGVDGDVYGLLHTSVKPSGLTIQDLYLIKIDHVSRVLGMLGYWWGVPVVLTTPLFERVTSFTYISGVTTSTLHCINNTWLVHVLHRVFWSHYDRVIWPLTSLLLLAYALLDVAAGFSRDHLRYPARDSTFLRCWFSLILSSSLLTVVLALCLTVRMIPNLCINVSSYHCVKCDPHVASGNSYHLWRNGHLPCGTLSQLKFETVPSSEALNVNQRLTF